jgi:copper chaperone
MHNRGRGYMIETNFKIDGMSCGGCVRSVTNVLKALPGVEVDSVTVGGAQLRLAADPMTEMHVVEALKKAGFAARKQ